MNRFLMVTAAVVIGVITSQVFFSGSLTSIAADTAIEASKESLTSQATEAKSNIEQAATVSVPSSAESNPPINSALISSAPADARVFIIEPVDGATVSSPVLVKFGIENMTVEKAGNNVENSGHHHLLIDLEELPDLTAPLPATEQLIHFGGAQTETSVELEAGEHTLQLLLGNYLHIPHDQPVMSDKITVTVK